VSVCLILGAGLAVFVGGLALHVLIWRVKRPVSYRAWLPLLAIVFGPMATAAAWYAVPAPGELAAVLLLHYALSAAYVIGYTLISAFSPSVEMLKLIDRAGGSLPVSALDLPFLAGALTDERIRNLEQAGLVTIDRGDLVLGRKGRRLTSLVLLYRRAIGLSDGGGG
jgi:hypothetical protein